MSGLLNEPGGPCHCDECTRHAYAMGQPGDVDKVIRRVQSESPRLRVEVRAVVAKAAEEIRQQAAERQPLPAPRRPLELREYGTRHRPPRFDSATIAAVIPKFIVQLDRALRTRKDQNDHA